MSTYTDASLIYYPSGYKEDKIYSLKPTDGSGDLTFTRASSATRVNAEGLIETSPVNLVEQSETFDNAFWLKGAASITANATVAPNGTTTADKFIESATLDTHQIYTSFVGNTGVATLFIYAKKAERSAIQITIDQTTDPSAIFNLDTGVIYSSAGCTPFIESVGNGWYKCGITYIIDQTTSYPVFRIVDSSFSVVYTGNGTSGIFLWGAQINIGATAKPYFPTTDRLNVPRIDYTGGGCGKLLLEPQRTNLITYSSEFDNAAWTKSNSTISANVTTSPDGTTNADKIIPSATASVNKYIYRSVSAASGSVYSIAVFAKAAEYDRLRIEDGNNSQGAWFNLSSGTVGTVGASTTANIEALDNGWYRCSISKATVTTSVFFVIVGSNAENIQVGDGTSGIYIYGAQLEQGSYSTSLINTTSTAVTRLADSCSKTGISDKIGQTEGTLFVEVNANATGINQDFTLGDGTANNQVGLRLEGPSKFQLYVLQAGVVVFSEISVATFSQGQNLKMAAVYKSGAVTQVFVNGVSVLSATADSITGNLSGFFSGRNGGTLNLMNSPVKQILVFPSALSDAEAITLTTL